MSKEINEFKLDVLDAFTMDPESDDTPPLIIQTSNGTINGKLANDKDLPKVYDEDGNFIGDPKNSDTYFAAAKYFLGKFREQALSSEENEKFVKGVLLKDVKIFLPSQKLPLKSPYYFLFLDQVVGVTIGDLKSDD